MNNPKSPKLRVVDVSQFLPGPFAAQMFADMGADVLKIEPPAGDPMRSLNPVTNQRQRAPFHAAVNAGKRVVTLDLKSNGGKRAFLDLVTQTDILIESYRPGVMARLGLDYDILKSVNPGLIYCALSGYGQFGPLCKRSGHDINYLAMSGGLNVSGAADKPQQPFPPVADYGGAMQAVIAIQNAIINRYSSGEGCYLDVAMADTMISWQAFGLIEHERSKATDDPGPQRSQDLLNGGAACYHVYETSDGRFVSLGAIEAVFWENFCTALARPEWVGRLSEALPQTGLIEDVAALFLSKDRNRWDQLLGGIDCCYHPVLSYEELATWPQIQERQLLDRDEASGQIHGVKNPVWQNKQPPESRSSLSEISIEDALAAWS